MILKASDIPPEIVAHHEDDMHRALKRGASLIVVQTREKKRVQWKKRGSNWFRVKVLSFGTLPDFVEISDDGWKSSRKMSTRLAFRNSGLSESEFADLFTVEDEKGVWQPHGTFSTRSGFEVRTLVKR